MSALELFVFDALSLPKTSISRLRSVPLPASTSSLLLPAVSPSSLAVAANPRRITPIRSAPLNSPSRCVGDEYSDAEIGGGGDEEDDGEEAGSVDFEALEREARAAVVEYSRSLSRELRSGSSLLTFGYGYFLCSLLFSSSFVRRYLQAPLREV